MKFTKPNAPNNNTTFTLQHHSYQTKITEPQIPNQHYQSQYSATIHKLCAAANDVLEKQAVADENQNYRHKLIGLEERALSQREFLANMMAAVTAQTQARITL